ncbi:hypothetical protein Srot_0061 [Segniliparus rotundus DSM 44985]|uniref:Uncharacterized protein n=1 Tax=Segniliparus rotundus (strain ATCC BAA-972 / CDC 1076 / CIP 108378 / DSM 44985 / JCM 13578) TaxID=640132 RepID=D6Z9M7_SEGRD|nr:hypothetical protein [Segniliparus rotundus]ADG96554.1 hypothetical protein Srot_0061 [Segniliparus rotundus DSM 44985]
MNETEPRATLTGPPTTSTIFYPANSEHPAFKIVLVEQAGAWEAESVEILDRHPVQEPDSGT